MGFCIDVDECKKENIPVDAALYIAAIYLGTLITPDTFQKVCRRGLIEYDGFDLARQPVNARLTKSGVELIESIFLNSEFKSEDPGEDKFEDLAIKLREIFPTGKKPGTSLMWRDSTAIITKKLKTLAKKYQCSFTDEQAINAAKKYVESFNGDYRFMQVLKYFICKKDVNTGDENSQLLSYIANEGAVEPINDSWMDSVR